MSEETKDLTIEDIIKWCDEQVAEGYELKICWEGGGDSGWCWFEIDGLQCSTPEAEWLIDKMYDTLDYGSWAGEYSANGEAVYDAGSKEFEGTDYYSTDEEYQYSPNQPFIIKIPKDIHFDSVHIECEGEAYEFHINASVRNGFFTPEAEEVFANIEKEMNKWCPQVLEEIESNIKDEIQSCWHDEDILKDEFDDKGDHYEYVYDSFTYRTYETEDKSICINLKELLENE
jgi:hypothetical protein